ncbi:MAG: hypothetical protein PW788_11630 [Micavibrio sp.]|nr:hypothetical protein [Micavibrio sp.]
MKKNIRLFGIVTALAVMPLLSGCGAGFGPQGDPAYVAPDAFDGYTCNQLHVQMNLTTEKINDLDGSQQGKAMLNAAVSAYAASQGYGFDHSGNNAQDDTELRRQKNKYDVLEETAVRKNCLHVN